MRLTRQGNAVRQEYHRDCGCGLKLVAREAGLNVGLIVVGSGMKWGEHKLLPVPKYTSQDTDDD